MSTAKNFDMLRYVLRRYQVNRRFGILARCNGLCVEKVSRKPRKASIEVTCVKRYR